MRTHAGGLDGTRPSRLDAAALGHELARLHRVALALCGSHHEADDLVQETCACVLARPRTVRGDDHGPYLTAALRHTFVSQLRAERRRPRTPVEPARLEWLDRRRTEPDRALDRIAAMDAVCALPSGLRQVVAAVDLLGLSYEETARLLDLPVGTVMSRLHRARERLARAME
jgi:RNA polymerase sigma-70 factor (ECF subfamily)